MATPPVPSPAVQVATMGVIVGTLTYLPLAVLLGIAFRVFGISPEGLVTFAGTLGFFLGLVAWWLVSVGAGCIYAAFVFPWESLPRRETRGQ